MYTPIQIKGGNARVSQTTTMSVKGMDKKDAPQFLDINYALNVENYEIKGQANLERRKGITEELSVAVTSPITFLLDWTDDLWIFGYGTTIAKYVYSTKTITTIKSNFSANAGFDGDRYGEYFFVCNGVDKIWRISDAGANINQITNSPAAASVLKAIGPRLYTGFVDANGTPTTQYSEIDDATNPPFQNWNIGILATDGGSVSYRNASAPKSILPFGEFIVVFCDKGMFAFGITVYDSAGTATKKDDIVQYTEDFGGARGAILTEKGVFYANEVGLWNLVSIGLSNVPQSKQYSIFSTLLGDNFFDDIDASNGDLFFDRRKQTLLFTCAQGSETNNLVISCNLSGKDPAFSKITGWNISRFTEVNGKIYGGSDAKTTIYELFSGETDDGLTIGTDYLQEIRLGNLDTKNKLKGCYVGGFLSPSSEIQVAFDIYDTDGSPITDKLKYQWTPSYNLNGADEYGSAAYSSSSYGGDNDSPALIECFDGARTIIRNFNRIRLHITSNDDCAHILTWCKLDAEVKSQVRTRKLLKLTS